MIFIRKEAINSVYVIADLHLSTAEATNKPMEVFGRRWTGYTEKIEKNWRAVVSPEDTVIVPGDISWALTLEESLSDMRFIDSLPGKKLLGKGNHDFWWATMAKMNAFCEKNSLDSISFLYNNASALEDFIVCGTRGWFNDSASLNLPAGTNYDRIVAREANRLRMSIEAAKTLEVPGDTREKLVFLHFPPVWNGEVCREIIDVLHEYGIKRCYFGHIHGAYTAPAVQVFEEISFSLVSADFLNFAPRPILPEY